MSTQAIQTVVAINAPPAVVWAVLTDFPAMGAWNPFLPALSGAAKKGARLTVTVKPPGRPPMAFRPQVLVAEPEKELRWRGQVLLPGLFDGEHYFKLTAEVDGTTFLTHGEVFSGLLGRWIFTPALRDATLEGFEIMNKALKARAEAAFQETD
ncbi:MAG: SRPBCC domain-containing protein [Rhodospirillum sp.]|nr:SRPBCC domain-containing protein [Rhodospirillum sp.]MCF8489347.1 SRPBCC domain-containing protein [Rhodospirillum sp.]MCF8500703.1 SRPBCC domain-containing protein [Rhodospirillum sp.]